MWEEIKVGLQLNATSVALTLDIFSCEFFSFVLYIFLNFVGRVMRQMMLKATVFLFFEMRDIFNFNSYTQCVTW